MARIQNPIIGRAKGQAGGMVFTTLNGQNVMKAKPNSYRDANTAVQQDNRTMHKDIVKMVAQIKGEARSLFEKQPSDMPAFSKLVQQFSNAVDRSGANPVFNPRGMTIGSGSVDITIVGTIYSPATGAVGVEWVVPPSLDESDQAVLVDLIVINKATKEISILATSGESLANESAEWMIRSGLTASDLCFALKGRVKFKAGSELAKTVK